MNVNTKTTTTFEISTTQHQAQDLLTLALKINEPGQHRPLDADEKETLNNLRQALLTAGVIPKRETANAD